jgi:hypothetical protein
MKHISAILFIVVATFSASAQPADKRKTELSISGSFQSYSSDNSTNSSSAFLISPRVGFYVKGGLEIEPELTAMFATGGATYILNGNLCYNFLDAGKGIPFLLLGYGISNTVPFFSIPLAKTDFSVGVLNVGGGVKAFLVENVALRIEYRFQSFSGEKSATSYGSYVYTQKVSTRIHTIQFGLAVLL